MSGDLEVKFPQPSRFQGHLVRELVALLSIFKPA